LLLPILTVAGLLLLAGGIVLPLMRVEKWLFWEEHYSILAGAMELALEGQAVLALGFTLFVILLPLLVQLAQIGLALIQLTGRPATHRLHWLLAFNRWAMMDVFALAIFIAALRLSSMTELTPLTGLWCLMAGLVASVTGALWLRRIFSTAN
jgi:paraquat-inducible protein A